MIENERLQAWLEATGLQRESALIDVALRVRTDVQRQYLRSVYDNIQAFGHILGRWEAGGSDCYGMAGLAAAWARRAPTTTGVGGIPGRELRHQPGDVSFREARRDNEIDDQRDALYLLMQCMVPQGADTEAHLALRAWAFLNGIRLSLQGQTTDEYLAETCRVLRLAAYELPDGTWRQALAPLGQWTRTQDELTEHIRILRTRGQIDKARSTARAIGRICSFAEGKRRPIVETIQAPVLRLQGLAPPTPAERLDATSIELPRDLSLAYLPADHADTSELDLLVLEVDPDASPEAQSLYVRAARLQLSAAARFLGWDWCQVLPPERHALEQAIDRALTEPADRQTRLLASFTWFAMSAGLSLEEALQVPIKGDQPPADGIEWLIDIERTCASRIPPRRADHRRPSAEQADHLRPAAEKLHFQLPGAVWKTWKARSTGRRLHRLGQLWVDTETTPSAAFRHWVRNDVKTRRLQPSMLRQVLGQCTYEAGHDHVLARLLPSTPGSALPAATIYTAFAAPDLKLVWPNLATTPPQPTERLNVAGSLLDPDGDEQFADAFRETRKDIEDLRAGADWIAFHNAVAVYWDAALRAATGVRPVNDLWMSEDVIDWDEGFVYVDDKASPVVAAARLMPLPTVLRRDLAEHYLRRHLPWVLERMRQAGVSSPPRPLLFCLNRSPAGVAVEAVRNERRRTSAIGAPLPLNIFRHRLRTQLHRDPTVNKEVIDSLLGHGDGATRTHGDHSMRTWAADAAAVRDALDRLYGQLSVHPPALRADFDTPPGAPAPPTPAPFALALRRERSPNRLKQYREAVRLIERYLIDLEQVRDEKPAGHAIPTETKVATKPLDILLKRLAALSSEQLDRLGTQLLKSETQLVDPAGVVRYEFLLRLAQEASSRHGLRMAIRRRYGTREMEDSPFRPEAVGAVGAVKRLRACLDEQFATVRSASRVALSLGLLLLQLDLCLVSRITHRQLLDSLLDKPDRWRIVKLGEEFHLEWSPQVNLRIELDAACIRLQISTRAAWLFTEVVEKKARRRTAWDTLTTATSLFAAAMGPGPSGLTIVGTQSNAALIEHVITLVDQANIIELPGTVAGFLGGRVATASLGWGEWLRLRQGRWVNTDSINVPTDLDSEDDPRADAKQHRPRVGQAEGDDADEGTIDPLPQTSLRRGTSLSASPHDRALRSRELVQIVQRSIRALRETRGLTKRRQKQAMALSRLIREGSVGVSSTVQLLCLWAIDMLIRPGRSRKLATSSVERYFVALSPRFKTIGSDIEIDGMDDEQIEAFYRDVLDLSPVKVLSDVHTALRSFHAFAHRVAGLPAIDWSMVAVEADITLGAPGFIDETAYLQFLQRLDANYACAHALPWQLQCFVILCFRFGLRAGECAGLTRADLVWLPHGLSHVLARRNRLRGLKTTAARRAVPLLFSLSQHELAALQRLRDSSLPIHGRSDEEILLFAPPGKPETPLDDRAIRRHLNAALQQFTGQVGMTLHDLRHSFATHLWAATQSSEWKVLDRAAPNQEAGRLRGLLLGTGAGDATRRAPWAIARLMGHAHPRSALQSYVHSISDTHRMLLDLQGVPCPDLARPLLSRCVVLDTAIDHIEQSTPARPIAPLEPGACLAALRYLAAGRTDAEVQDMTRLSLDVIAYLRDADDALAHAMNPSKPRGRRVRLSSSGLAEFVPAAAHSRLRNALTQLAAQSELPLADIGSVSIEEWAAMTGPRRQISLWTRGQFALFALAIRTLAGERRSVILQLQKHRGLVDPNVGELADLAHETGWLLPKESGVATRPPLCTSLTLLKTPPPPVYLKSSGAIIRRRAVLSLAATTGGPTLDRAELIICALCICAFARQELDSPRRMR